MLSNIVCFETLIAWQKARDRRRAMDQVTQHRAFAKDFGLTRQIQRAAVSIMSNIAEGVERSVRREFHQLCSAAQGACGEVRSPLYVAFDVGYLVEDDFQRLLAQAAEVGRVVGGLRASVEKLGDKRRSV